jgi:hypothetical protein
MLPRWLRFRERRLARRWRRVVSTPVPDEIRERVRREVADGTRPVVHLQRRPRGEPEP